MAINSDDIKNVGRKDIISQASAAYAVIFRYGSLVKNVIAISIFLILGSIALYYILVPPILSGEIGITTGFYIQLGIYLLWFLVLRRFVMKYLYGFEEKLRKDYSFYTVEENGLTFNLRLNEGKLSGKLALIGFVSGILAVVIAPLMLVFSGIFVLCFILIFAGVGKKIVAHPLIIKFDEVDEIRELDYVEAKSLLDYQIGPNVSLAVQGAKDMYDYLKKKIERPNVYVMVPVSGNAKTILIKGAEVFYLSVVENQDFSDLIDEFNRYKEKHSQ